MTEEPTTEQVKTLRKRLRENDLRYRRMQAKAYAEEITRFEKKRETALREIERLVREIERDEEGEL